MPYLDMSDALHAPAFGSATSAEIYTTALDMFEWADEHGFNSAGFLEHHGSDDGVLPSPLVFAAAAASRTTRLYLRPLILAPLYHPLRLAEDIAVLDLVSRGRIVPIIAAGYRTAEFAMFDVDRAHRARLVEETVESLKLAWTGEPFSFRGKTVKVTPMPAQRPRPPILIGGSSEAAARRAARIADGMYAMSTRVWEAYRQERRRLGSDDPGEWLPRPLAVHVTQKPELDWPKLMPHVLHMNNVYADWNATDGTVSDTKERWRPQDEASIRNWSALRVVTPEECVELCKTLGSEGVLRFCPLFGGIDPTLAWSSLRLFADEVLPHISVSYGNPFKP